MKAGNTIIQIMQADGWHAVFLVNEEPWFVTSRLAGWALVREPDGSTFVDGMDAESYIELCQDPSNFHVFAHESEIETRQSEWIEEAKRRSNGQP